MIITDSIEVMHGIGAKSAQLLRKLQIYTLNDLLYHVPVYYKDSSQIELISELDSQSPKTVKVNLERLQNIRLRQGKSIQKGTINDVSGRIEVIWFNQPFLVNNFRLGEQILLYGKLNPNSKKPQLYSPEYAVASGNQTLHLGRIVPVYKLTAGITAKWLRARIFSLLEMLPELEGLTDKLSEEIRSRYFLIGLHEALRQIHFPDSVEKLEQAKKRLGFEELLEIQLKLKAEKQARLASRSGNIRIVQLSLKNFLENLPFKLTNSQQAAAKEILRDLTKPYPMKRLLQGDVGSGKTVVAAIAALPVAQSGYQVAVLAPTSILATQLYENFRKFLPQQISISLITAKTNKGESKNQQVIIGTHAILHRKQQLFKNLGLVIIDEQHRFGVEQRHLLQDISINGIKPNVLNLTATPIPRTLAMTLFGDLDVTVLESEKHRLPATYVVPEAKRIESYNWIEQNLNNHGQAFWVLPAIEEQEGAETKSVLAAHKNIKKRFPEFEVGLMHGKMKENEKQKAIHSFRTGKTHILVSTTVIEVGIDIPDANLIIIESAERFGLAQLHQLRGRVGRRNQDSWCLLFTANENTPQIVKRLNYFAQEKSGIKIAEYDLAQRGPGEVYGRIQSGLPALKVASFGNLELMLKSKEAAELFY